MLKRNLCLHLLLAAALIGLPVSQWFIWIYAPVERTMGPVQKIFYFHLPFAWWGFVSFFIVFVASIGFLWKRKDKFDIIAWTAAEIGVLFSTMVLGTGILWARASWNTWWTWDPRLTTALVLWFIYAGYLLLRKTTFSQARQKNLCAVLGIVGFIDVPLVFLSARLLRSIHPSVFHSSQGGLPQEMWITVMVCLGAWGVLFASLFILRLEQFKAKYKLDALFYK